MQKNYIRHNFSAAALERIVGQAHRTDEVAALGNVLAGAVILLSNVPLEVMNAMMPPVRSLSMLLAKK
ncbi:hypothetical protein NIA69_06640 [Gemmiger formicilis]|nr:hypothetical protein [Gemmiger formicilis]